MDVKKLVDNAVASLARRGVAPILRGSKMVYETNNKPGGPWVYIKYSNHNCTLLKTFMFEEISKTLPRHEQFIPIECQSCYKVVARPEKYEQLLELKKIMEEMNLPSKCGIEKREAVDALYGGYWYCEGGKEGLERLDQVGEVLSNTKIPYFLKRGCTEYEAHFGPSNGWGITPGQRAIEKEVFSRVEIDNKKRPQLKSDIEDIMKSWEIFAAELGPDYVGSHNYITYGGDDGKEDKFGGEKEEAEG